MICGNSWGGLDPYPTWTWCVLPKGHTGSCKDWRGEPPHAPFFHDQPLAMEMIAKQVADERRAIAKKGGIPTSY